MVQVEWVPPETFNDTLSSQTTIEVFLLQEVPAAFRPTWSTPRSVQTRP